MTVRTALLAEITRVPLCERGWHLAGKINWCHRGAGGRDPISHLSAEAQDRVVGGHFTLLPRPDQQQCGPGRSCSFRSERLKG